MSIRHMQYGKTKTRQSSFVPNIKQMIYEIINTIQIETKFGVQAKYSLGPIERIAITNRIKIN